MPEDAALLEGQGAALPDGLTISYTDDKTVNMSGTGQITDAPVFPDGNDKTTEASLQALFLVFGKYVWIAGIGIMLLYCMISAVKIRRRVSSSIPNERKYLYYG